MGHKHPLRFEYTNISTCLAYIQDVLFEANLSYPQLYVKIPLVKATDGILWFQNNLLARRNMRNGEVCEEARECKVQGALSALNFSKSMLARMHAHEIRAGFRLLKTYVTAL